MAGCIRRLKLGSRHPHRLSWVPARRIRYSLDFCWWRFGSPHRRPEPFSDYPLYCWRLAVHLVGL